MQESLEHSLEVINTLIAVAILYLGFRAAQRLTLALQRRAVFIFLAAIGVFARDIGQITGVFTVAMLFLAPVFYPVAALPKEYQPWIMANPLTFVIEQTRAVLIAGQLPDWKGLVLYTFASVIIAWAGFWWFQKTRKGFADVL